jgi:large subunit ribosomal protein L31
MKVKKGIHPKYGPSKISCACGNVIETKSTKPEMKIEVCSVCHPFFTGKQRVVDTTGRVEKFKKRYGLDKAKEEKAK